MGVTGKHWGRKTSGAEMTSDKNFINNDRLQQARKNAKRWRFQLLLLGLSLSVFISWASKELVPPPILQGVDFAKGKPGTIQQLDCPFALEGDEWTRCYRLYNWQNPEAATGPVISSLAVVIEPWGGAKLADPFVYLEGGPGQAAIYADPGDFGEEGWVRATYAPILESGRSLILFDSRGLGFAQPALSCPRADKISWRSFSKPPEKRNQARIEKAEDQCLEAMQAKGVDFNFYNSRLVAQDLTLLRTQLGIEQWNIYGISYGAQTALHLMENDRAAIRSAIFDSPAYASVTPWVDDEQAFARVLTLLDDYCAARVDDEDSYCPHGPQAQTVSARLDDMLAVRADHPLILRRPLWDPPLYLDDRQAVSLLHGLLYGNDGFESFLWDLLDLYQTKPGFWQGFSHNAAYWHDALAVNYGDRLYSWVVHDATACVEMDYGPDQANHPIVYTKDEIESYRRICAKMGLNYNGRNLQATPFTGMPILTLSGERDPITPPEYGRQLAEDSNSLWWQQPAEGHGILFWTEAACVEAMAREFLDTLTTNPAAHCNKSSDSP